MLALIIAITAIVILPLLIGYELRRRARPRVRVKSANKPRRLPYLEERVRQALDHTKQQFGEVFTSYKVWSVDKETRLEIEAAPKWKRLSEFTRSLIVRHLWRTLEAVSSGSVVIVDDPPMEWTREVNLAFRDRGVDPWRAHPLYAAGGPPRYKR
jgi:hypothetical protein